MNRVFLCSPYNSTMFTSCCEVAITESQDCCPQCKQEVYPGKNYDGNTGRARWEMAYGPTRRAEARRGGMRA